MIQATIQAEISDKNEKLLETYPEKPANSLLKNFISMLGFHLQQGGSWTVKKTSGSVEILFPPDLKDFWFQDGGTYGIRVGSGSTPVTMDNYTWTNLGSLTLGNHSFAVDSPASNIFRLRVSRTISNPTGSPIQVNEVCWIPQMWHQASNLMIDRTLYSVSIPGLGSTTITYRIWITL